MTRMEGERLGCNLEFLVNSYECIMSEIQCRFNFIDRSLNRSDESDELFVMECVALNMRFICEAVTSALMTANTPNVLKVEGDRYKIFRQLHDDWDPGKRISKLENLINPRKISYPYSCSSGDDRKYFDKSLIVKINGVCGDILHRESVKKYISDDDFIDKLTANLDKKMSTIKKFRDVSFNLLRHHKIDLDDRCSLHCLMSESGIGSTIVSIKISEV